MKNDIPVHEHIVYDPKQREYYNCRTDIFLTDDDISFYKLRPYDKITCPLPNPRPLDYFTNWEQIMKKPSFDDVEAHIQDDDHSGWCTNCGDWTHDFCEPDAHNYECPVCEERTCYGAEELLLQNLFE